MIPSSFSPDKLRRLVRVGLVAALCLFASANVLAQGEDDPVETINTNLIVLNVGVADRKGEAVTDLRQNDFSVFEDGVRQQIVSFEPASAPFSLVLLLDVSGSTLNFRPMLKQSALRFVDALRPEDRVSVVAFNEKVDTFTDFTTDRKKIAFAITAIPNKRGETNLYPALRHALSKLSKEGKRRKAIVVLTDGLDTEMSSFDRKTSAQAQTKEDAVASIKPDESASLRAVLDAADRQGVTVYPLALPSADPRRLLPLTPQQAAVYTSARARMQTLAARTGGRLHEINRLEDMGRLYAEVAADLRTLYSIAYQSSNSRPRDGNWRAINVQITRADAIARSRPGYFAR